MNAESLSLFVENVREDKFKKPAAVRTVDYVRVEITRVRVTR